MNPNDTQASGNDAPVQDTATTQPSEASEVTNVAPEADQANVAVQETETTDVNATDTASERLFAGKYKTVEDLENAYRNAESKLGQTNSEKAELSRQTNQALQALADAEAANSLDIPSPDVQKLEKLERVTAVQSFIMSHPDADAMAMHKVLTEDPLVSQISGNEARLEYAFLRSQSMAQPKAIAEAEKRASNAALVKTAEKQAAQVESGRKAEPVDENAQLYERATGNYSREERDKARLELIRKNLINL